MTPGPRALPPAGFGSWQDAEALRRWSFRQRTPQQRLDWLVDALRIRYQVRLTKQTKNPG